MQLKLSEANNVNWMNLLRLAFRLSPKEAGEIMSNINLDTEISNCLVFYQKMNINGFNIEKEGKPFIIAEISANHNGSIDACKELIRLAKLNGANAVKIQTYKPETITLNSTNKDFMIADGLWKGKSLFELYDEAHTPWEWHEELFSYAKVLDISLFSSPFDSSAIDLLRK